MTKENALLDKEEDLNKYFIESFDFDELEKEFQSQLEEDISNLEFLKEEKIHLYFDKQIILKDKNFANGRLVRNLYDDLVMNHARRVIKIE